MKKVPLINLGLSVGLAIIAVFATLYGFIISQPCDIDKVYFWCHTHPVGFSDIFGLLLMWAGVGFNWFFWVKKHDSLEDRALVNYLGMIAIFVGIIIMWL